MARRQVIERPHAACNSHSTGPGATIKIAVAFGAATVAITSPKSATSRHLVRVAARMVRPINHPSPAHGSNIAEVRETYGNTYGDSW